MTRQTMPGILPVLSLLSFKTQQRKDKCYVYQITAFNNLLRHHDMHWDLLPKACHRRQRVRSRRPFRRSVAHSFRLRHFLLFSRHLHRVRRTIRMEIRDRIHMDRNRQRFHRIPAGLGRPGATHQNNDPAS